MHRLFFRMLSRPSLNNFKKIFLKNWKINEKIIKVFEKHRPTHVFHLAAKVGGLYGNMRANLEFFRINMAINDNVLSLAKEFNVKKVKKGLGQEILKIQLRSSHASPHVSSLTRPLTPSTKLWFTMVCWFLLSYFYF